MNRSPRQAKSARRFDPKLAIPVVLLAVAAWFFWPSAASRVRNLDSRGQSIIAFGDSLTAGVGASPGEDYPSNLAQRIGRPVINAGVSGDTTDSALARLQSDVLALNPWIVIVGLGGNDYLRRADIATTEGNLRTIIREIHGAGAMVVLLGFRFPSLGASYESMYERIAEEERCLLIPDLLDGILRDSKLKSDEIHPNARGYDLMAERVESPLQKLIATASRRRS